jgi:hypothetical protein
MRELARPFLDRASMAVGLFADTAARLAPVSSTEALVMLDELKMAPLLRGTLGELPVARSTPLTVGPDGAVAVDARARLSR